jgi:hypothetical protein
MLFRRYLLSLLALLVASTLATQFFPFVTHSHVLAGVLVEETFSGQAVAFVSEEKFLGVQARLPSILQENTSFAGTGAVQIITGKLELPNPAFTRNRKASNYATPALAHVQWMARPEGTKGTVETHSGPIESTYGFPAWFEGPRGGPGSLRQVTVHGSNTALAGGRLLFGLAVVLPIVFTLHTPWWMFFLRREKRTRLPALLPPDPPTLPITFHPSPVHEWQGYTFLLLVFSIINLFVLFVVRHGIEIGAMPPTLGVQIVGLLLSLGIFWMLRRGVVTLKLDEQSLSYARGRRPLQWTTNHWADLRAIQVRTVMHKGIKHEWLEIEFAKGQKYPIYHKTILNYPLVRDTLLAMFAKHHPGK